jgi:hypothetical protein
VNHLADMKAEIVGQYQRNDCMPEIGRVVAL